VSFPGGVVLPTGTSLVSDLPFTLIAGDEIRISIPEVGELVNRVVRGKAAALAGFLPGLRRPGRW
jgi:2-dehydro-3-deoxy-D-arabinonate dehydratase